MRDPPYVGPVPFGRKDAPYFAGRDCEAAELTSIIRAHCLTIFYAPSGAGKTSLLSALVIPRLEEQHCEVLPIGRVAGTQTGETAKLRALRPDASPIEHQNPFAENLLAAINPDAAAAGADSVEQLSQCLSKAPEPGDDLIPRLRVVIIDQFEELFTKYPEAWPQREVLLGTIAKAIDEQPSLSVVFSMREEYVPALEPLLAKLVFRTQRRFRLPLLGHSQAAEAIREPAAKRNVEFSADALDQQVKQLRGKSALSDRGPTLSEFVEPLTLQVVCLKIWDALPEGTKEVDKETVLKHGHLEAALEAYYDKCISDVAAALQAPPWKVRAFVQSNLIDARGQRKLFNPNALTGAAEREAKQFIDELDKCRILRPEVRHGETSYELAHDQFVPAIVRSNSLQQDPQSALVLTARRWFSLGQPPDHLLSVEQLEAAKAWIAKNDPNMFTGREVALFIEASEKTANEKIRLRKEELEKRREELEKKQQELEAKQAELTATNQMLVSKQDELKAANENLKSSRRKVNVFAAGLIVALLAVGRLTWVVYERGIQNEETAAVVNQEVAKVLAGNTHPSSLLSTALALSSISKHRQLGTSIDEARAVIREVFRKTPPGRGFWKNGFDIDSPIYLSTDGASAFVQSHAGDLLVDTRSLEARSIPHLWEGSAEFVGGGRYLLMTPPENEGGAILPRLIRVADAKDLGSVFDGFGRLTGCCQVSVDGSVMLIEGEKKVSLVSLDGKAGADGFRPLGTKGVSETAMSADGKVVFKTAEKMLSGMPGWIVDAHDSATDRPLGHITSWVGSQDERMLTVSNDGQMVVEGFQSHTSNSGEYQKSGPSQGGREEECSRTTTLDRLEVLRHAPGPKDDKRWVRTKPVLSSILPIVKMRFVDDSNVIAVFGKCLERLGFARIRLSPAAGGSVTADIKILDKDRAVVFGDFVPQRYSQALHVYVRDRDKEGIELLQFDGEDQRAVSLRRIPEDLQGSLTFNAKAGLAALGPRGGALINFFDPAETSDLDDDEQLLGLGCRFAANYLSDQVSGQPSEQHRNPMVEAGIDLCRKTRHAM